MAMFASRSTHFLSLTWYFLLLQWVHFWLLFFLLIWLAGFCLHKSYQLFHQLGVAGYKYLDLLLCCLKLLCNAYCSQDFSDGSGIIIKHGCYFHGVGGNSKSHGFGASLFCFDFELCIFNGVLDDLVKVSAFFECNQSSTASIIVVQTNVCFA